MQSYKLAMASALLAVSISAPAFADGLTVIIGNPPPPAIVETMPPAPGPAELYAWHAGHWRWIDETHVWVPGHWVKRPYPEAVWVEPIWLHDAHGYHFQEGHWDHPVHEDHHDHHDDHHDHHDDHRDYH